jgi:hypothetical protein
MMGRPGLVMRNNGNRRADLLSFVELRPFMDGWRELGLTDDDAMALEIAILQRPSGFPVVQGTGGLRKMRFAPPTWRKVKRGAVRVGYAYLEQYGTILLVIAYAKTDKDDLRPKEKKAIRQLLARVELDFAKGVIR